MLQHKEVVGALDRLITFEQAIYGTDESNQHKITGWEDIDSYPEVYAKVVEPTGMETFQGDQMVAVTTTSFTIRYRTDVTVQNRVVYNSKYYDIHAILEIGRRRFLKLTCESGGQYKETTT